MKPDIGLIADAALTALHENAKRVERVAMQLDPGPDRDELVWTAEAMRDAGGEGRRGLRRSRGGGEMPSKRPICVATVALAQALWVNSKSEAHESR